MELLQWKIRAGCESKSESERERARSSCNGGRGVLLEREGDNPTAQASAMEDVESERFEPQVVVQKSDLKNF